MMELDIGRMYDRLWEGKSDSKTYSSWKNSIRETSQSSPYMTRGTGREHKENYRNRNRLRQTLKENYFFTRKGNSFGSIRDIIYSYTLFDYPNCTDDM